MITPIAEYMARVNITMDDNTVTSHYTGWPKKVSHYRESSLNCIKNREPG